MCDPDVAVRRRECLVPHVCHQHGHCVIEVLSRLGHLHKSVHTESVPEIVETRPLAPPSVSDACTMEDCPEVLIDGARMARPSVSRREESVLPSDAQAERQLVGDIVLADLPQRQGHGHYPVLAVLAFVQCQDADVEIHVAVGQPHSLAYAYPRTVQHTDEDGHHAFRRVHVVPAHGHLVAFPEDGRHLLLRVDVRREGGAVFGVTWRHVRLVSHQLEVGGKAFEDADPATSGALRLQRERAAPCVKEILADANRALTPVYGQAVEAPKPLFRILHLEAQRPLVVDVAGDKLRIDSVVARLIHTGYRKRLMGRMGHQGRIGGACPR